MNEEIEKTILPCPFCSSKDAGVFQYASDDFKRLWPGRFGKFQVECPDCLSNGPVADTLEEAVMAWNDARGIL